MKYLWIGLMVCNVSPAWVPHTIITDYLKWNDAMCGDINQDGYVDIAAASYDYPQVVWFDGSTSWTSITTIDQSDGRPWSIDISDINDDGYPDIIAGWDDGTIRVYSGFDLSDLLEIEFDDARDVHSGDFNDDGLMDIASVSQSAFSNQVVWFENPSWNINVIYSDYPDNDAMEVAFLAQDSIPSVIAGRFPWGIGEVAFWRNIGGEWNKTVLTDNYNGPRDIRAEDIDMDSDTDILVAGRWAGVSYWINEGNGEFSSENVLVSNNGGCVAAIPNESNTCKDIIVGFDDTDTEQDLRLYLGPGYNDYILLGTAGDWTRAHVFDMDNDGDLDILGVSHHGRAMHWFESEYGTGIESESNFSVKSYVLHAIQPNPATGSFNVSYSIPELSRVSIDVFDLSGRLITNVVNEEMISGTHSSQVSVLPIGVYICRMESGEFKASERVVVIR